MKYKEYSLSLSVSRKYAKPYIQKIKQLIWNRFESTCEVEDNSFDVDEDSNVTIYFLATVEQAILLKEMIAASFKKELEIHFNY